MYFLFAETWIVNICASIPTVKRVFTKLTDMASNVTRKNVTVTTERSEKLHHFNTQIFKQQYPESPERRKLKYDAFKGQVRDSSIWPTYPHDDQQFYHSYISYSGFTNIQIPRAVERGFV
jgi:hypothetical protein